MNRAIRMFQSFIGFGGLSQLVAEQRRVVKAKKIVREKKTSFPRWFDEIVAAISDRYPLIKFDLGDPATFLVDVHSSAYRRGRYGIPGYIVTTAALRSMGKAAARDFMAHKTVFQTGAELGIDGFALHRSWETSDLIDRKAIFEFHDGRCCRCGTLLDDRFFQVHYIGHIPQEQRQELGIFVSLCADCHSLMDGHHEGGRRDLYLRPLYLGPTGRLHREGCRHVQSKSDHKQWWPTSEGYVRLDVDPPVWMVTPDNPNNKGWKLISQCKVCIDNEQPYLPDDRLGVERAIDEFGERGFEQARSYYEDYVPTRSAEDSWDKPAIAWPSRLGFAKGELDLLRGEIIRQALPTCQRDLAILEVSYSSGLDLRRVSNLKMRDIKNNWFAVSLGGYYEYTGHWRIRNISWRARKVLKGYCTGLRRSIMGKKRSDTFWDAQIFVAEDGEPMTETKILSTLRDYASQIGITRGIRLNTFVITRARHMLEDGYTMRRVRQFFLDSPYPEAETGDYGDLRSLISAT